jgi:hypothetical protein
MIIATIPSMRLINDVSFKSLRAIVPAIQILSKSIATINIGNDVADYVGQ